MPSADDVTDVLFSGGYIPLLLFLVYHILSPPNCPDQLSYIELGLLTEHASLLARIICCLLPDQTCEKNAGMCWHFPYLFANHKFLGSLDQFAAYRNALTAVRLALHWSETLLLNRLF